MNITSDRSIYRTVRECPPRCSTFRLLVLISSIAIFALVPARAINAQTASEDYHPKRDLACPDGEYGFINPTSDIGSACYPTLEACRSAKSTLADQLSAKSARLRSEAIGVRDKERSKALGKASTEAQRHFLSLLTDCVGSTFHSSDAAVLPPPSATGIYLPILPPPTQFPEGGRFSKPDDKGTVGPGLTIPGRFSRPAQDDDSTTSMAISPGRFARASEAPTPDKQTFEATTQGVAAALSIVDSKLEKSARNASEVLRGRDLERYLQGISDLRRTVDSMNSFMKGLNYVSLGAELVKADTDPKRAEASGRLGFEFLKELASKGFERLAPLVFNQSTVAVLSGPVAWIGTIAIEVASPTSISSDFPDIIRDTTGRFSLEDKRRALELMVAGHSRSSNDHWSDTQLRETLECFGLVYGQARVR